MYRTGGLGVAVGEGLGVGVGVGVGIATAPATISNVMLCAGTLTLMLLPLKLTSLSLLIVFAEVSCHACARPLLEKLFRLRLAIVLFVNDLLMIITVSAPSPERIAANDETVSGSGTLSETLMSPNVDLLPS